MVSSLQMHTLYARIGLVLFFTIVFLVVYAVSYSVVKGAVENYYRYAQKSDLQWTGPGRKKRSPVASAATFVLLSLISAWLVVDFVILR